MKWKKDKKFNKWVEGYEDVVMWFESNYDNVDKEFKEVEKESLDRKWEGLYLFDFYR